MPRPEFQAFQYAFAAHLRDPQQSSRPAGVDARRMQIYRTLVYNNVEGFLLACFPVVRNVLGKRKWTRLVRAFLAGHHCRTPFFRQIPDEFLQFLQTGWQAPEGYPDFLLELAHYEWIELALSISNKACETAVVADGDLMQGRPVLNPVLASLRYRWPVHRIRPRRRVESGETFLLVFRDTDLEVRFMEMNAFTARLLALLTPCTCSGRDALEAIARESGSIAHDSVIAGGEMTLRDLRARGALLGVAAG